MYTFFLHTNVIIYAVANPVRGHKEVVVVVLNVLSIDLLRIPQSEGENVKTFRWDQRLQRQNLFMAFNRVPRW